MTDGEPEPFRMSTNADDGDPDDGDAADGHRADGDAAAPGTEGLGDLIDEATRAADEQSRREEGERAPADRSGDVWGRADDEDEDLDAVWAAASERHRGSHVFDDMLGTEDTWRSSTRIPPPAADPAFDIADLSDAPGPGDDEPEVFKLQVEEDADDAPPAPPEVVADAPADVDEGHDDPAETGEAHHDPTETGEAHHDPLWGPPDAADDEDVWGPVDEIDEVDPWGSAAEEPVDDRTDAEDWPGTSDDRDAAEHVGGDGPEPFRFAAGPQTSAPAAVPDHVENADDDEPDLFAFAFADPADGPRSDLDDDGPAADTDADDVDTDAADDAGDVDDVDDLFEVDDLDHVDGVGAVGDPEDPAERGDGDDLDHLDGLDDLDEDLGDPDDDMVWSAAAESPQEEPAMTTEPAPGSADAPDEDVWGDVEDEVDLWTADEDQATDDDEDDEPPLAETVRPRSDAGWDDQSRDAESWALDAVTVQVGDVVELRDEDDDEDPSPISTREPDPPFETGSSALGDVLEDLLGDLDEPAATEVAAGPTAADHARPTTDDLPRGEPSPAHDDALPGDAPDRQRETAVGTGLDAPTADAAHTATPSAPTSPPPSPGTLPPPPASDAERADDEDTSDDDPAAGKDADEDPAAGKDADEEPTAEEDEEVTPEAPTGLSFSSSSSPKKRGLFGR